jgi:RimJ/RimL family protein N-acetyltransferase
MTQKILDTERLRLVPLAEEHLEFEVELDSDPEVMRCLAGRASSRAEVEQAYQRRLAAARGVPGLGFWAGFTDGDFVGWWILQPPNGPDQPKIAGEAGLGYRLLRRHWRRGYASEGARALIRYGFADLGLHRIFAQTMAVNLASRATMNAVGLTFTRAFISSEPYDDPIPGAEQGEVEYEITPEDMAAPPRDHRQHAPTPRQAIAARPGRRAPLRVGAFAVLASPRGAASAQLECPAARGQRRELRHRPVTLNAQLTLTQCRIGIR